MDSVFGVPVPDPRAWGPWMWSLHGLGALYVIGFIAYYFRFSRLLAQARKRPGDAQVVGRFNRALHGFPNAFYAKQFGMNSVELREDPPGAR